METNSTTKERRGFLDWMTISWDSSIAQAAKIYGKPRRVPLCLPEHVLLSLLRLSNVSLYTERFDTAVAVDVLQGAIP